MIKFSTSILDFVSSNFADSKICEKIWKQYYKPFKAYEFMFNQDDINLLDSTIEGTISYLPKGREIQESFQTAGRQAGKPAKVIRKLFTAKALKLFKDSDFDLFNNLYKSHFSVLKFELLDNSKIKGIYDGDRKRGGSSLNNSCMNGDGKFLDMYESCDQLQVLVLKNDEGLLCGRALVWSIKEGIYLDRIYVSDAWMYEAFYGYAAKLGWNRKAEQSYSNKTNWINPDGQRFQEEIKIKLDTDFDQYPYLDTFSFGGDGFISNYDADGFYDYTNTDGTRESSKPQPQNDEYRVFDSINRVMIPNWEARRITNGMYEDSLGHRDQIITDVYGNTWWNEDNGVIKIYDNSWHFVDEVGYCEIDHEYYLTENVVEIEAGSFKGMTVHNSYSVYVRGAMWCIEDEQIEEVDGTYQIIKE